MSDPKTFGLLGYPVKHSFSPAMHTAAFRALQIDAEYKLFEKKPEELSEFLSTLDKQGISGLNVTVPYKEKVLEFIKLDQESTYLKQLKAVNTLVYENGIWKGFNTDISGFQRHIKEHIDPVDKKVAVLGAGGASRAVVYALANLKAAEIVVYDIDSAKSQDIVKMTRSIFSGFNIKLVYRLIDLEIQNKDILINTTPVGMKETDPCLVSEDLLHPDLFVYDLIYNPAETKLLKLAKQVGAKHANGLKMLLYQGMLSFTHWTKQNAPEKVMWEALQKELGKCRN